MRRAFLILVLIAIGAAFASQWWKAHEQTVAREKAERQLTLVRIVKDLGAAAIDARRGEYEAARREASAFFTAAHYEIDQRDQSPLSRQQREALGKLLGSRDELITSLARSEPASADRLAALFVEVRKVIGV